MAEQEIPPPCVLPGGAAGHLLPKRGIGPASRALVGRGLQWSTHTMTHTLRNAVLGAVVLVLAVGVIALWAQG